MGSRGRLKVWLFSLGAFLVLSPAAARAETLPVAAGGEGLKQALAQAAPGDVLDLAEGIHAGPVVIDKPLNLQGHPGTVVQGTGEGIVLKITAAGTTLRGLTVRGSGTLPQDYDGAIFVAPGAHHVVIENNRLEGNLFGIVLQGTNDSIARGNHIANRTDPRIQDRGNGINMWNNKGTLVENNVITSGRDGIYIHSAHGNIIRGNRMSGGLRFGIHWMYANRNEVSDNISVGNDVGFALMYSDDLKVIGNVSIGERDQGLLFHTSHHSIVAGNYVKGAGDKCAFVYTSARNTIRDNRFEECGIGIHFTGGSENNHIFGNAFINNKTQVKYPGTVFHEWSKDGRGNFWSDNPAFDLNGDGIADIAYRPNTIIDRVVWKYPLAKLLLSSPALETLRFAQSRFPALYPGGVIDSAPLMKAPPPPVPLPALESPKS